MYSFKRKRGPRHKSGRSKRSKTSKPNVPNVMSSFERRLWEVFFIIFRNSKTVGNKYSWCWFARQLKKLDNYVKNPSMDSKKTARIAAVLDSFMESLDMTKAGLDSEMNNVCPFAPDVCSSCSSVVINHPSLVPGVQQINPEVTQTMMNWGVDKFQEVFDADEVPCFVMENRNGSYGAFVNKQFEKQFAYDSNGLNSLLTWSGGGFLPWGGDLIAALLVHQADLLLFLQILAFKYQATGLKSKQVAFHKKHKNSNGTKSEEWRVPSCHMFYLWVRPAGECNSNRAKVSELRKCLVNFSCQIRMREENGSMSMRVEFMAHNIQEPEENESPVRRVTHDLALGDTEKKQGSLNPRAWDPVVVPEPAQAFDLKNGGSSSVMNSSTQPNDSTPILRRLLSLESNDVDAMLSAVDRLPSDLSIQYQQWQHPEFRVQSEVEDNNGLNIKEEPVPDDSFLKDTLPDDEWLDFLLDYVDTD